MPTVLKEGDGPQSFVGIPTSPEIPRYRVNRRTTTLLEYRAVIHGADRQNTTLTKRLPRGWLKHAFSVLYIACFKYVNRPEKQDETRDLQCIFPMSYKTD